MAKDSFYRKVFLASLGIASVLVLCRLTLGAAAVAVALVGVIAAIMHKPAALITCFVTFPLIAIFNRAIIGVSGLTLMIARFSFILIVIASLIFGFGGRGARESLPLRWMVVYLAVACFSSIGGWMPLISFLKIINFGIMLMALYLASRQMQQSDASLRTLRAIFMAMAIIMIVGSLVSYFVPSVGFSMMIYKFESWGINITGDELAASDIQTLFNGMTCHSQMLSPVVACLATWVLCDMLLIERRFSILHCFILMGVPVLLYMSRSRGGILMLISVMLVTVFATIPRAELPRQIKRHLGVMTALGILGIIIVGVYYQIQSDAISRWLRKTDDVRGDNRSLQEAFTGSRRDALEMNMYDFRQNPVLGKGFQVVPGMDQMYATGEITWYSAAIEKGVTPYVILGETGIVGAIVFLVFLCSFYATCFKRGYMSLMTNFTCFLVANLADSTFFSPAGLGGFMWTISCVGAFSTDCLAKRLYYGGENDWYVGQGSL